MKKSKYNIKKAQFGVAPNRQDYSDNESYTAALEAYISSLGSTSVSSDKSKHIKEQALTIPKFVSIPPKIQPTTPFNQKQTNYPTGTYDFSPEFKMFNAAAQFTTGIVNKAKDIKNRKEEYKQYLDSIQVPISDENQVLNDIPTYMKTGGLTKAQDFAILNAGEVKGHKLTKKQRYFFEKLSQGKSEVQARKAADRKFGAPKAQTGIGPKWAYGHMEGPKNQIQLPAPSPEYLQAKELYFKYLQQQGRRVPTDISAKEAEAAHQYILKNMSKYEGSTTPLPIKDAAFQAGNTIRSWANDLLGTHMQMGGCANCMDDNMKTGGWIQGAIKHPGRCAHPGSPECPKGSPQYNLAMRFKHGDLHKAAMGIDETYQGVPTTFNGMPQTIVAQVGKDESDMYDTPQVEAEEGEVYTTQDGSMNKVPEGAGTHEEGGVILNNVDRVLEDTSDKRKDAASKALKVSPLVAKLLTGVETKSDVSHSKLLEHATAQYGKKMDKIQSKLQKNVEALRRVPTNPYAKNSLNMNLESLSHIPTEQELFDKIFNHQETVKAALGIGQQEAKYGGKYQVAQWGIGNTAKMINDLGPGYNRNSGSFGTNPNFKPEDWKFMNGLWYHIPSGTTTASDPRTGGAIGAILGDGTIGGNGSSARINPRINPNPVSNITPRDGGNLLRPDLPSDRNLGNIGVPKFTSGRTASGITLGQNTGSIAGQNPIIGRNTGKPNNTFNEPLNWFDVAGPISSLTEGRIPVKYNPVQLNKVKFKLQNPLPALNQGQADYNAIVKTLGNNPERNANLAAIYAQKYSLDNQTLGQYQNANTNIINQQNQFNAGIDNNQALYDQKARDEFEYKYLGSLEADRAQKKTSWDELFNTLAQNKKLNREGNLLMKLFPAFNQNAEYNGYKYQFRPPLTVKNNNFHQ